MTQEELDAIRDRHAKATPGIWRIWGGTVMAPKDPTTDSANVDHNFQVADTYCVRDGKPRSFDATFIAMAHQDIPELLAEIDRLRAAVTWQDIATAPKDGTRIILRWDDAPSLPAHVELATWKQSKNAWCNTYGHPFSGEPTEWLALPGSLGALP